MQELLCIHSIQSHVRIKCAGMDGQTSLDKACGRCHASDVFFFGIFLFRSWDMHGGSFVEANVESGRVKTISQKKGVYIAEPASKPCRSALKSNPAQKLGLRGSRTKALAEALCQVYALKNLKMKCVNEGFVERPWRLQILFRHQPMHVRLKKSLERRPKQVYAYAKFKNKTDTHV